jgi:transposase InsO family protein
MRRIVRTSGRQPIHFVADSGRPYCGVSFRSWCRRTAIDLQHGVIGQVGSIAFMERLIQTIKCECTRLIAVPYRMRSFDRELALYREWYNGHRPHRGLEGATPDEIHDGVTPASQRPRGQMGDRDAATVLVVGHLAGRRHLPVVSIGRAA